MKKEKKKCVNGLLCSFDQLLKNARRSVSAHLFEDIIIQIIDTYLLSIVLNYNDGELSVQHRNFSFQEDLKFFSPLVKL